MAITYVGGVTAGRAGATSTTTQSLSGTLTGGSNTSPSPGDLVVVFVAVGGDGTGAPTSQTVSGNNNGAYTSLTFQSITTATYDSFSQVGYKIQGGTVDTTVTIPSSANVRNAQRWVIHVFRGVDSTTPIDVTSTYATGSATGRPNPAAITPTTAGAWIVACYASAAATGAAYTAPTDFATDWLGGTDADTADVMAGAGYYTGWTSGSYDPAAITAGGTTNAADSWTATTLALRPSTVTFTPDQTAFRFYEDGTETGSTAIANQNTNISRDTTTNSNLQLRVRIQETAGAAGASTDDYQLQYRLNGGAWTNVAIISADPVVAYHASANLTDSAATTNRLGAGTGSFVAGEISEDSLVDNLQLTASNYTELLYSVTIVSSSVANGDTIDFRTLLNGATMTYTVTPTITVIKHVNATYIENFQGGTNGTSLTTGNSIFNTIYKGSSADGNFTFNTASAQLYQGGSSLNVVPATAGAVYLRRSVTSTGALSLRGFALTGIASGNSQVLFRVNGSSVLDLTKNGSGFITFAGATSSSTYNSMWIRVEITTTNLNNWTVKIFSGSNLFSDTPTETLTPTSSSGIVSSIDLAVNGATSITWRPANVYISTTTDQIPPIVREDTTQISSSETSDILATIAVSSSDSTEISSSETSNIVPTDVDPITEEETFESANSGDALTVGTIVDAQATPGSSTLTVSTANPLHGSKHARHYSPNSQSRAVVNIGTTQSLVYTRMYIYWDTMPTANNTIMLLYDTVSGTTVRAGVQITTGGSIRIRNGLTAVDTGTYTFSANTWYRMEWKVDYTNTTQELRVWTGANLESSDPANAVELKTGVKYLTGTMNTGTFERWGFGPNETGGATINYDVDSIAYGAVDWIGPYSTGSTPITGTDSTQISSSETSATTAQFTATDTTAISSTETAAIQSTLSRTDSTDITSAETAAIQSTLSRTDSTEISSTEGRTLLSTLSRTDSTEISSSETSSVVVQISSSDTTQITTGGSGADPQFRSSAAASIDTQTLTVNAPSGMQVGDTEILIHHWNRGRTEPANVTGSSSTGWTRLISTADYTQAGTEYVNVWYRTVPSGENTTSLTLAPSNFAEQRAVRLAFYGTDPITVNTTKHIASFNNDADGVYQTPTASGIVRALQIHFATVEYELTSQTITTDGALTEIYNSGYTNPIPFIAVGTEAASGNTSARNFTLSVTGNDGYAGLIRLESQASGEYGSIQSTLSRTDSTEISSSETRSFSQVNFSTTDTTQITGTDASNMTATFPGSDATLISSSETSEVIATGTFDKSASDTTDIGSTETSSILSTVSRTDTTQITSAETSSFAQVNFTRTDTTDIASTETRAIQSTLSRTDSTDISSSETSATTAQFTRTDSTDIGSTETSSILVTQTRTDTTDIASSETRAIQSTLSRTDSTDIASTETASVSATVSATDSTQITGTDASSTAVTLHVSASDSTQISSSETSNVDTGSTQLIRHEERFNGGSSGTAMTSGNTAFTLFPGTGTMEFSNEQVIQGGTGGKFVATNAAQGKRGKIEGLVSRRTWYARFYYYKSGNPSAVNRMMIFETAANASPPGDDIAGIREEANGNLTLFNGSGWATGNPVTSLANGWHRIELKVDRDGDLSTIRVWSGANIHSTGTADQEVQQSLTDNGNEISVVGIGNYNAVNQTRHFEDFAVGDQNWIGPTGNIDISATDSTQISSTDTSATTAIFSGTDTTSVTSAETSSILVTLSRTDSTDISSSETRSFGTVAFTRTDSTEISSTETSQPFITNPGTDSTIISSSETSDIQVVGTVDKSASDTTDITSSETSATTAQFTATDTTSITSAETASISSNFTRTDTTLVTGTDASAIQSTLPRTDSTDIASTETSAIQSTLSRTDSTDITSTESRTLQSTLSRTDSTDISSAETSATTAIFSKADTTDIASAETASVSGTMSRTDTTDISSGETRSILVIINSADSTQITSADASSFGQVNFTRTDTTEITSTETSSFGQVNFSSTDTTQITSSETASIFVNNPGTDSTIISSSETSDIQTSGGVDVSSSDSTAISSSESTAMTVMITSSDSTEITSTETRSFPTITFAATDSTQVTSADTSAPLVIVSRTDSTEIGSSETTDIQTSGSFNISGSDSTQISSTETSSLVITTAVSSSDSTQITSTDASSFGTVAFTGTDSTQVTSSETSSVSATVTATDSTQITSADSGTPFANLPGTDATLIGSSETSQIDLVGNIPVSSNDSTSITSSETSQIVVTLNRPDSTQITSAETAASYGTVTSTDSTQISSTEGRSFNDQPISSADSTQITSTETSSLSILEVVFSADSTEISSSETSSAAGYKAGQVSSHTSTDLAPVGAEVSTEASGGVSAAGSAGRKQSTKTHTDGEVSSSTDSRGGVSSA